MATGELVVWDHATAVTRPDLAERVRQFAGLATAAGDEAATWLRETALANDGSTRTWLLVDSERVAGYFALCAGAVTLHATDVELLGLPPGRHPMPAIVLAWIARHRDGGATGLELMQLAFAIARRASRDVGAVAFVLDPRDDAVADVWRAPPYAFRESSGGSRRLWLPLSPEV